MSVIQILSTSGPHSFFARNRSRIVSSASTLGVLLMPVAAFALINPSGETPAAPTTQQSTQKDTSSSSASNDSEEHPAQPEPSDNTQVTVNGQSIDVPSSGSVHKTVPTPDGNGSVTVDVNNNQQSSSPSGAAGNSSSINVEVNSSSNGGGSSFNSSQTSTFVNNNSFSQSFNSP